MTEPTEFMPHMTIRPAIMLEQVGADLIEPEPCGHDHIGVGALEAGEVDGNPPSVLIAIRHRGGVSVCAATDPDVARAYAADILAAADKAEGKANG